MVEFNNDILNGLDDNVKTLIEAYGTEQTVASERTKNELLSEVRGLKEKRDGFGGWDVINAFKTKAEEKTIEVEEVKDTMDTDKSALESIRDQLQTQLDTSNAAVKEITQGMVDKEVALVLTQAVSEAKGDAKILTPLMRDRIKGKYENGKVTVEILNADGNPMLVDGGGSARISDLVTEFKNDSSYSRLFDGAGGSGSGATNTGDVKLSSQPKGLTETMKMEASKSMSSQSASESVKQLAREQVAEMNKSGKRLSF